MNLIVLLEESGKKCNVDFWVAFSPEREDPNNQHFTMRTTPKIVGADDPYAREWRALLQRLEPPAAASFRD